MIKHIVENCQRMVYYDCNILCVCGGNIMAYVRTVKFSYYTVCEVNDKEGREPIRFDFERWIAKARESDVEKKEIEIDGLIARLEEYEGDAEHRIWKLRFMKLRDTNIPSIVKREEDAKPIELEDDEYIGEDLLMIYDPEIQVAMIQCNRFAMSKGKLEKYLNRIWGDTDCRIVLIHINKAINYNQLKKKNFRKLEVRMSNIHAVENTHRPFASIVNSYNTMGSKAGVMAFSLGRGRQSKEGLSTSEVPIMLDDIYDNMDIVDNAILKVRDDDNNSNIDIVDLFDNCLHEYIDFRLEKRTALAFGYATRIMVQKYLGRKDEITRLLA